MTTSPDLSAGFKPKRFASLQQLRSEYLREDVPESEAKRLWDYVLQYDLSFSLEEQDCSLYSVLDASSRQSFWTSIHWSGIQRICMRSGLWIPGRSDIRVVNGDIYAFASCHVRRDTSSNEWLEVTAYAKNGSHYERDIANPDAAKRNAPIGDWALVPEILLDEIAQYNAAAKALGSLVTIHKYKYATPAVVGYDRRRKTEEASGRVAGEAPGGAPRKPT